MIYVFEPGYTYSGSFPHGGNERVSLKVVGRTETTLTDDDGCRHVVKVKEGSERVFVSLGIANCGYIDVRESIQADIDARSKKMRLENKFRAYVEAAYAEYKLEQNSIPQN